MDILILTYKFAYVSVMLRVQICISLARKFVETKPNELQIDP